MWEYTEKRLAPWPNDLISRYKIYTQLYVIEYGALTLHASFCVRHEYFFLLFTSPGVLVFDCGAGCDTHECQLFDAKCMVVAHFERAPSTTNVGDEPTNNKHNNREEKKKKTCENLLPWMERPSTVHNTSIIIMLLFLHGIHSRVTTMNVPDGTRSLRNVCMEIDRVGRTHTTHKRILFKLANWREVNIEIFSLRLFLFSYIDDGCVIVVYVWMNRFSVDKTSYFVLN